MKYVLEACVDSVRSAIEAENGGALRVELCSNLIIGGTSPGNALFRQVREHTNLEIRVLLRPRFGDFCYDEYEFAMMKEDTAMYRELGAEGLVTGILKPDGNLNTEQLADLKREAGDMKLALHRAFDVCRDPFESLEAAIALGFQTILTSGQKGSAWEGRELLKQLVEKSAGRIEILHGAGITPEALEKLLPYTGGTAFHMSGKTVQGSPMEFRRQGVSMGLQGLSEWEIWQTSAGQIRRAVEVLRNYDNDNHES